MDISDIKLVVTFRRVGPYHRARLKAVAKIFKNLTVIEGSGKDQIYAWNKVDTGTSFQQITLFPDDDAHFVNGKDLSAKTVSTLNQCDAQVVVIHGWSEKGALATLGWCRKKNIPAVVMSESQAIDRWRSFLREFIKKIVIKNFSCALCGGKPHMDYLVNLGMPQELIFTGYDVVDNNFFIQKSEIARDNERELRKRYNLPEKYFLASGRFIRKKNFIRLLKAYADYRKQGAFNDWKLVLLGDGELRRDITDTIKLRNLEDHVLLPGFKQYEDLPVYYGLAKIFIHCSTTEQWGLVVNEAMASGLPVLVSNRCGCAYDLVEDGKNGFLFNPYDTVKMTNLLVSFTSNRYDIEKMGRVSRDIIKLWSPDTFAANLKNAVKAAFGFHKKKFGYFDRLLLYTLTRWP